MSLTLRTRLVAALSVVAIVAASAAGCSSAPAQRNDERPRTNCFNHCAYNLAQCTEDSGGDFSDCSRQQDRCESDCEAQRQERREEGDVFLEDEPPSMGGPGADVEEAEEEE